MNRIGVPYMVLVAAMLLAFAAHAQPSQQGSHPQVPLSYGTWLQLKDKPVALGQLGAGLPGIEADEPGRKPAPPLKVLKGVAPALFSLELAPASAWSNLANVPPGGPYNFGNPLLLTDGTVIVHRTDTPDWYRLTPSITGSYINGIWTRIASMQTGYGPKFFASAVLPDGRVIVEGGEYNMGGPASWGTQGSIYDPTVGAAGAWTAVAPPKVWNTIGDAQSTVLASGRFMLASCCDDPPTAALLNPVDRTWSSTGSNKADRYDEESWTLLPDETVLTVDAYTTQIGETDCGLGSEHYDASSGSWSVAANVPNQLSDCSNANTEGGSSPSFEIGPQVLMYNGKVIAFGGTTANVAHVALYDITSKTWSAGPDLPSTCGSKITGQKPAFPAPCTLADAPATLLPNGNVLFVASAGKFNLPANFFEYDAAHNSYTAVDGTSDASGITSFYVNFLTLPTGQILAVENYTSTIQVYSPSGNFDAKWQPVVTSAPNCVVRGGKGYVVAGAQLNGLSQSANYGDDQQAATNYPLVRIVNQGTKHVFYARTHDHSTMTVAANAPGSTHFDVAAGTEIGASTLYVVANGIPSKGATITVAASACSQ